MTTKRRNRALIAISVLFLALTVAGGALAQAMERPARPMMGGMQASDAPRIPSVTGYVDGQAIFFLHTETSDPKIAKVLTDMMGSPVLVVPALAEAPAALLATVYVFTNGVKPDGPRGPLEFQPDVFDSPPATTGYSPLRKIVLVTWKDDTSPRVLKSATEVEAAINDGAVTTDEPGVVVNMPFVTWPGGRR